MLPFADIDGIETAPLPIMVAVACVGWLIVRGRRGVIQWWITTAGSTAGAFFGKAFVAIGGYAWLVIGVPSTNHKSDPRTVPRNRNQAR